MACHRAQPGHQVSKVFLVSSGGELLSSISTLRLPIGVASSMDNMVCWGIFYGFHRSRLIKRVDNPLTCGTAYSCTNYGTAFGCCTGPAAQCENIYTNCFASIFLSQCDSACLAESRVLKWYHLNFEGETPSSANGSE